MDNNGQMSDGYGSQQPMQGQPYPQQLMQKVPRKSMDPKTKRLIVILCSVFGGLLVLSIVTIIVLPVILKVDYEETYGLAKELNSAVDGLSACGGVVEYAGSVYTTEKEYGKYITRCKEGIVGVKKLTGDVEGTSGLRDGELKELWDVYKLNYERLTPIYEKAVEVYPFWHEFVLTENAMKKDSDWYKTMTEDKMNGMLKSLQGSGVDDFEDFAEGYRTKYIPYVMAYKKQDLVFTAYTNTSYNASNRNALRDEYYSAREATSALLKVWNEWKADNTVDLETEEILGVDLGREGGVLNTSFSKFYSELRTKHSKQEVDKVFKGFGA